MRYLFCLLFLSAGCSDSKFNPGGRDLGPGGDGGGHSDGGGGGGDMAHAPAVPCDTGNAIPDLPVCTLGDRHNIDVPLGCIPTVDGTLHDSEWADGTCFSVGSDTVVVKYAGDAIYLAFSGQPSCGCGMPFYFDPDGFGPSSNNEFRLLVFDDPFNTDGDVSAQNLTNGTWSTGSVPPGLLTRCPGMQPNPIRYEWKIPLSTVGVTAGADHTWRLAINHNGATWPSTLPQQGDSTDPNQWGTISSSTNWQ